jgi:hypothetical protein
MKSHFDNLNVTYKLLPLSVDSTNTTEIESVVSSSSLLVFVLSNHCLKAPAYIFAMEASLLHTSTRKVLVHGKLRMSFYSNLY